MLRYTLKRLGGALPMALGVVTLAFVLLEAAPGSPSDLWLGSRPVPEEVRERIERAYGLDRPAPQRYVRWLSSVVLSGELGWSHSRSKPVALALRETLPATLLLSGAALALNLLVGLFLGVVSAAYHGRWTDRVLTVGNLLLYAMPAFWVGTMSILLLSYMLPLFPSASMHSVGSSGWSVARRFLDLLWHLCLPACVLGLASAAALTRFVRAGLLEALGREFVRAARARGADGRIVLLRHALRNAMIPVVNLVGLSLPVLISGSLVIEVVFGWPGMGRLTYDAIRAHDVPVVLASTLLAALIVVVGNLAADLAMAAVDPRVRLDRRRGSG